MQVRGIYVKSRINLDENRLELSPVQEMINGNISAFSPTEQQVPKRTEAALH